MREVLRSVVNGIRKSPALNSMARACVKAIPDRHHVTNMRDIGPVAIRLRRHRYLLWEHPLIHDAFMVSLFARLIRPGDVVYDIGANIGLYTRIMRQWFGASYLYAFEPMRENRDLLAENIRLGNMQELCEISALALSDAPGKEELQIDDMNSGSAVLNSISGGQASSGRAHFGLPPKTESVELETLDAFVKRPGVKPPAMMKIDTEGAEVKILIGGRETIRTHKPRMAIALHGKDKAKGTLEQLEILECPAYGYVRENGKTRYQRLAVSDFDRLGNNNILAAYDEALLVSEPAPLPKAPNPGA
ncbi:MAG: FkbM family methyltransferase [Phycisphaerales bacterium]